MLQPDFEKLGVFYLGRRHDLEAHKTTPQLCLYESTDLLTHAVCIGMTGSGKTGLCIGLIEEALIDGIPVIAIDPKGDISNLLLTFPELSPSDFQPWLDADEAKRQGKTPEQFAAEEAAKWKDGLQQWNQTGERIRRLKESADFAIYTPGSNMGLGVSIMSSLAAPPAAVLDDSEALNDKIASTVSSLLSLLSIDADPLRSREHILLSTILKTSWSAGKDLNLPAIIQLIQKPPFTQIGALDVDSFFPAKDRFELAMALNNLLASPGFELWSQGEPLDVQNFLYTQEGKPRAAIFSIAHLDDAQRMFAVSLLLNQIVAWMRAQSGTSSLRAILYMDEMFGYLPPTANPPSKRPLLTLMKQARAFGLGVVLATQNPVDIDYKALSNAGTWFIGRLQTERDKLRVLDGLEGASTTAGGSFDRQTMDKILSQLGRRVFLMNNVHDDAPTIFETRWTLSYLRGPLNREQIKTLTREQRRASKASSTAEPAPDASKSTAAQAASTGGGATRPVMPAGVKEFFLPCKQPVPPNSTIVYRPRIYALGNVRFTDAKSSVDTTLQYALLANPPQSGMPSPDWSAAPAAKIWQEQLLPEPDGGELSTFMALPPGLSDAKQYTVWSKEFATWLYNNKRLTIYKSDVTNEFSKPRELDRDFRVRLSQAAREQRDAAVAALKAKYAPRLASLQEKLRRAQQNLEKQQAQAHDQQLQSALSVGATVLGAFMGRRVGRTTVNSATSAARRMGQAAREQQDVEHAGETVNVLQEQLQNLNQQFTEELSALQAKFDPQSTPITEIVISPKKTNVTVPLLVLVWAPFAVSSPGVDMPLWTSNSATYTLS